MKKLLFLFLLFAVQVQAQHRALLGAQQGGTGDSTLTPYGVMLGNGLSPVFVLDDSTSGFVLTSNGAGFYPSWQPASGGGGIDSTHNILNQKNALQTGSFRINGSGSTGGNDTAAAFVMRGAAAGGAAFSATGVLASVAQSNGQVLIGNSGGTPAAATITPGAGINITNSPGGITISATADSSGGSYVQNQNATPQIPGNFNIKDATAITGNYVQSEIKDSATSSTSSVENVGLFVTDNGANTGTNSNNVALFVSSSGGTNNTDIGGPHWGISDAGALTLGTPLTAPNGGTGLSTLTAHDVLVGNGTGSVTLISPTTNTGYVLTSNGTGFDPTFQAVTGGSSYWFPGAGAYPLPTIYTDSNVVIAGNDSIVGSESVGTSLRVGNANVTLVANTVALGENNNVTTGSGDFAIGLGNTVGGGNGSGALGYANTLYGFGCLLTGAYTTDNGYGDYTFIWGDGSAPTRNYGAYQFIARASGGFVFLDDTTNTPEIPVLAMRNDSILFDNNPISDATGHIIVNSLIPGTSGYVLTSTSGGVSWQPASGGGGSVTSVALALPSSILTVSGSPVTTSGTLTGTLATQTANTVWAGPTSGSAAAPTFRSIVSADVPTLNQNTSGTAAGLSATLAISSGGTGLTSTSQNYVFAGPTSGSGAPSWRTLVAGDIPSLPYGTGTVTSVDVAIPGMTSSGAITTSGTISMSGTLNVANGGTGAATLTSKGVLYGNGTSAVGITAAGSASGFLAGSGATLTNPLFTDTLFDNNLATTYTMGFGLFDTTKATAGTTVMQSPSIILGGNAWCTTATATDSVRNWRITNVPTTGNAAALANGKLNFDFGNANIGYANAGQLAGNGILNLPSGGEYQIGGSNVLTSNTLGSGVIASSLTSIGTLTALTVNVASVGATQAAMPVFENSTAATSGTTEQFSPMTKWLGAAWKSNSTAASQADYFGVQCQPLTGAAVTTANLVFYSNINAAGNVANLTIASNGNLTIGNHLLGTTAIGSASDDGTGVTSASVSGNDLDGVVTLTTALNAGGGNATITFGTTYTTAPVVTLTPSNATGGAEAIAGSYYVTASATNFVITFATTTAKTGCAFNYHVFH